MRHRRSHVRMRKGTLQGGQHAHDAPTPLSGAYIRSKSFRGTVEVMHDLPKLVTRNEVKTAGGIDHCHGA
jgi:hypothetical protein